MYGLRRIADQLIPLNKSTETRPSYPGAEYKGSYWRGGRVGAIPLESRIGGGNASGSWEITGYRLERTRPDGGYSESRALGSYDGYPSAKDVVRDLRNPKVVARMERVERFARNAKRAATAIGSAAVSAFAAYKLFGGDVEMATSSVSQMGDFLGAITPESTADTLPAIAEQARVAASVAIAQA